MAFFSPGDPGARACSASPTGVLWAILVVIIWKYFGLHMTIYIAGLQDIPKEQIEAARIDGASNAQVIFQSIILPRMRRAIQLSVFFSIIGSFQLFDIVWAMGKGDPVNARRDDRHLPVQDRPPALQHRLRQQRSPSASS